MSRQRSDGCSPVASLPTFTSGLPSPVAAGAGLSASGLNSQATAATPTATAPLSVPVHPAGGGGGSSSLRARGVQPAAAADAAAAARDAAMRPGRPLQPRPRGLCVRLLSCLCPGPQRAGLGDPSGHASDASTTTPRAVARGSPTHTSAAGRRASSPTGVGVANRVPTTSSAGFRFGPLSADCSADSLVGPLPSRIMHVVPGSASHHSAVGAVLGGDGSFGDNSMHAGSNGPHGRPQSGLAMSRASSMASYNSGVTTTSRPSRWGMLANLLSAGLRSFSQLAAMAEPQTGALRSETVRDLTSRASQLDLVRCVGQVMDLAMVGKGSVGLVYRGTAPGGLAVCVKYMVARGSEAMTAPATEGLLSRALSHPNVIATYSWHVTCITPENFLELPEALAAMAARKQRKRIRQLQQQLQHGARRLSRHMHRAAGGVRRRQASAQPGTPGAAASRRPSSGSHTGFRSALLHPASNTAGGVSGYASRGAGPGSGTSPLGWPAGGQRSFSVGRTGGGARASGEAAQPLLPRATVGGGQADSSHGPGSPLGGRRSRALSGGPRDEHEGSWSVRRGEGAAGGGAALSTGDGYAPSILQQAAVCDSAWYLARDSMASHAYGGPGGSNNPSVHNPELCTNSIPFSYFNRSTAGDGSSHYGPASYGAGGSAHPALPPGSHHPPPPPPPQHPQPHPHHHHAPGFQATAPVPIGAAPGGRGRGVLVRAGSRLQVSTPPGAQPSIPEDQQATVEAELDVSLVSLAAHHAEGRALGGAGGPLEAGDGPDGAWGAVHQEHHGRLRALLGAAPAAAAAAGLDRRPPPLGGEVSAAAAAAAYGRPKSLAPLQQHGGQRGGATPSEAGAVTPTTDDPTSPGTVDGSSRNGGSQRPPHALHFTPTASNSHSATPVDRRSSWLSDAPHTHPSPNGGTPAPGPHRSSILAPEGAPAGRPQSLTVVGVGAVGGGGGGVGEGLGATAGAQQHALPASMTSTSSAAPPVLELRPGSASQSHGYRTPSMVLTRTTTSCSTKPSSSTPSFVNLVAVPPALRAAYSTANTTTTTHNTSNTNTEGAYPRIVHGAAVAATPAPASAPLSDGTVTSHLGSVRAAPASSASAADVAGGSEQPLYSAGELEAGWRTLQDILHRLSAAPGDYLTRIVMEDADQGSLLAAIREGRFAGGGAEAQRMQVLTALDVARGLRFLHSHQVIHGDLKPSNVVLRSEAADARGFVAKVSDFGLSRIIPTEHDWVTNPEPYGTVSYMAPESISGSIYKASDVWSFGVVLWQMLTGEPPWPRLRNLQIMMGVMQGELRLVVPEGVYPPLAALVRSCMRHVHTERPTFETIVADLESMLLELSNPPLATSPYQHADTEQQQQQHHHHHAQQQQEQRGARTPALAVGDGDSCSAMHNSMAFDPHTPGSHPSAAPTPALGFSPAASAAQALLLPLPYLLPDTPRHLPLSQSNTAVSVSAGPLTSCGGGGGARTVADQQQVLLETSGGWPDAEEDASTPDGEGKETGPPSRRATELLSAPSGTGTDSTVEDRAALAPTLSMRGSSSRTSASLATALPSSQLSQSSQQSWAYMINTERAANPGALSGAGFGGSSAGWRSNFSRATTTATAATNTGAMSAERSVLQDLYSRLRQGPAGPDDVVLSSSVNTLGTSSTHNTGQYAVFARSSAGASAPLHQAPGEFTQTLLPPVCEEVPISSGSASAVAAARASVGSGSAAQSQGMEAAAQRGDVGGSSAEGTFASPGGSVIMSPHGSLTLPSLLQAGLVMLGAREASQRAGSGRRELSADVASLPPHFSSGSNHPSSGNAMHSGSVRRG